jgi:hypothetical protein
VLVHNTDNCQWAKMAIQEALESGVVREISKRFALVSPLRNELHHLFVKRLSKVFKKRYKINVDEFVIQIDRLTHEALHAGQKAVGNKAGWWGYELATRIAKAELENGGNPLSREQALEVMREMLRRFDLDHLPIMSLLK